MEETQQYDLYEDESQNNETFSMLDEEPEVTPSGGTNTEIQKYCSREETK